MKYKYSNYDEIEADFQEFYHLNFGEVEIERASRLLFQLPKKSRFMRLLQPANNWDWNEILLNNAVYLLKVLAWQNTKDAQEENGGKNAPTIFVPDFMEDMEDNTESMDIDELKAFLSRERA